MFVRIGKTVNFAFSTEVKKDVYVFHDRKTKEKIVSPPKESNLRPSDSAL